MSKAVTNILKFSLTHFVFDICHQHRCKLWVFDGRFDHFVTNIDYHQHLRLIPSSRKCHQQTTLILNQFEIEDGKSMTGICRNFKQIIIPSERSMKQLLWKWEIKNDWILKREKLKLLFQIPEFIQARFPIGCRFLHFDWLLKFSIWKPI